MELSQGNMRSTYNSSSSDQLQQVLFTITTRSALESQMKQLQEEMMNAGHARDFPLAIQKQHALKQLQALREYLPSDKKEQNLQLLNEKIEMCIKEQDFVKANQLQQIFMGIRGNRFVPSKEPFASVTSSNGTSVDRLIVLQSNPLVWIDSNNNLTPIPPVDFEEEKKTLQSALKDAHDNGGGVRVEVSFEGATTFRLSALLAATDNRVLHYSGHGNHQYLTMENWGKMQCLENEELKEFVSTGGGNLQFVFVSACHSRAAGDAFVKAGVRHVVCCHQDEELKDEVATEFTRHFYYQLACRQTIRKAFQMARAGVRASPIRGNAKFLLLPEKKDDDPYHDVQLFGCNPTTARASENNHVTSSFTEMLPPPPPIEFVGRKITMYNVIRFLGHSRFVQISGEPGVGKATLGHGVCSYIEQRKDAFFFEDIFWLPLLHNLNSNDYLCGAFRDIIKFIIDENTAADNKNFRRCSEQIASILRGRRALMFMHGRGMSSDLAMAKLRHFLEILFRGTQRVHVVLMCPSGQEIASKTIPHEAHVDVGPLNMRSSALLFGMSCPFVVQGLWPTISTPTKFADLLVPGSQADATHISKSMSKRCSDIFARIGEGKPHWIHTKAKEMSQDDYIKLVKMGMRQEFPRTKYDTRVELDQEWCRFSNKLQQATKGYDLLQAQLLRADLDELEQLRHNFPPVDELRQREKSECERLGSELSAENFEAARKLQRKLSNTRERIKKEEEALVNVSGDAVVQGSTEGSEQCVTGAISPPNSPSMGGSSEGGTYTISPKDSSSSRFSFKLVVSHVAVMDFEYSSRLSAIVCAANESCFPVPGSVCGAVIHAGGHEFQRAVNKLEAVDKNYHWGPVRCPTGEARLVGPPPGSGYFGDLNVPYVIFAVGPTYANDDGKDSLKQKDALLRLAYQSTLELAKQARLEAVAFSLISAGHRASLDLERPLRIAVEVVANSGYKDLKMIQFCAYKKTEADLLNGIVKEMEHPQVEISLNE